MRYWDASAVVPLLVAEEHSGLTRSWLQQDPVIVTWEWTRVEITSAIERRFRENSINRTQRRLLMSRLDDLADRWDEVSASHAVRSHAIRLLARHPLRAADAGQLAAAIVMSEDGPARNFFVCLDQRLAKAAELEGMRVLSDD